MRGTTDERNIGPVVGLYTGIGNILDIFYNIHINLVDRENEGWKLKIHI